MLYAVLKNLSEANRYKNIFPDMLYETPVML